MNLIRFCVTLLLMTFSCSAEFADVDGDVFMHGEIINSDVAGWDGLPYKSQSFLHGLQMSPFVMKSDGIIVEGGFDEDDFLSKITVNPTILSSWVLIDDDSKNFHKKIIEVDSKFNETYDAMLSSGFKVMPFFSDHYREGKAIRHIYVSFVRPHPKVPFGVPTAFVFNMDLEFLGYTRGRSVLTSYNRLLPPPKGSKEFMQKDM